MHANELELHEGKYILMNDVDRYNDSEYDTEQEAIDAMEEADQDGMWVGCVEMINDHLEIMFCCGDQQ